MSNYGKAALAAADLAGKGLNPVTAWEKAVRKVFPTSLSQQEKNCPRGAFLGLCAEGIVGGIARGQYTRSKLNKAYALKAVELLRRERDLAVDPNALWLCVLGGKRKTPNHQMDVVIALWDAGLIGA